MDYTNCNDDTLIFYLPANPEFNSSADSAARLVVDESTFWMRFHQYTHNLIQSDFDWSNIIMAGDCVHNLLRHQYQPHDTDAIDFYLFGNDTATIVTALETTIIYLQAHVPDCKLLTDSKDTVLVIAPNYRLIRLIITTCVTPHGVIDKFKASYQCIGLTDKDVVYGYEFVSSIRTNTCTIIDSQVAIASIILADRYGYQVTSVYPICHVYGTCIDYQVNHDLYRSNIDTTDYLESDVVGTLLNLTSYYSTYSCHQIETPDYSQFVVMDAADISTNMASRLDNAKTSRVLDAMCQIAAKLYEGDDMEHKLQQLLLVNDIIIHAYKMVRDRDNR